MQTRIRATIRPAARGVAVTIMAKKPRGSTAGLNIQRRVTRGDGHSIQATTPAPSDTVSADELRRRIMATVPRGPVEMAIVELILDAETDHVIASVMRSMIQAVPTIRKRVQLAALCILGAETNG